MKINQLVFRSRLFMARKVKSLAEAKPKITKLYDSFIENDKESGNEASTLDFENEFINTNSALVTQESELIDLEDEEDIEKQKFISTQLLAEPFKPQMKTHTNKVLKKLDKNMKWGLAGEMIKQKNKEFARDRFPTTEEIKDFLIRELFKDIQVFDLIELKKNQLGDIGIIASGYSHRHVYKAAKILSKEMEKLNEGILNNPPRIHGRKDDEWVMLCIGTKYMIHLLTENAREDAAIEDKWLDQEYYMQGTMDMDEIKKEFKKYENPFKFRNVNK